MIFRQEKQQLYECNNGIGEWCPSPTEQYDISQKNGNVSFWMVKDLRVEAETYLSDKMYERLRSAWYDKFIATKKTQCLAKALMVPL